MPCLGLVVNRVSLTHILHYHSTGQRDLHRGTELLSGKEPREFGNWDWM